MSVRRVVTVAIVLVCSLVPAGAQELTEYEPSSNWTAPPYWSPSAKPAGGVYSTRPGFLGADKNGDTRVDPDDIPVAITGIVPTKVTAENGPIEPGDLLTTSSTPGHAMKAKPVEIAGVEIYPTGAILGKALEPMAGERGVIRVLVMVR